MTHLERQIFRENLIRAVKLFVHLRNMLQFGTTHIGKLMRAFRILKVSVQQVQLLLLFNDFESTTYVISCDNLWVVSTEGKDRK